MKWVTRHHARVDRIACPWLIRNFIDKEAQFLFVPPEEVLAAAEREGALSFDAPNARYTHRDGKCSFETLMEEHKLADPALKKLALIVHGADVASDINITPQSAGLMAIADGFRLISRDDFDNMERQFAVYDALYAWCKEQS